MSNLPGHDRPLSILIPVYNEAKTIRTTLDELYDKCFGHLTDFELLMLEDGSSDGTGGILHACESTYPGLRAITEPKRFGFGPMVGRGILEAKKQWILLLDGDGQIEPADIRLLLECSQEFDMVTAVKFPRCDPIARILVSRAFDFMTDITLGISIRDINFGLKLMRTSVAQELAPKCCRLGDIYTAELVIRFVYGGYRLRQIQVRHRRRTSGISTNMPSRFTLLWRSLHALRGLFKLRKELLSRG
jgi:glycosyltransferase involved in cell wall biosynthesis